MNETNETIGNVTTAVETNIWQTLSQSYPGISRGDLEPALRGRFDNAIRDVVTACDERSRATHGSKNTHAATQGSSR